ncbi:unnamed protein product [Pseudo-nitzschia multistriata]|uniref:Uncharacterized protein n=1 Tax=Pseudo-nitzschia multistriata TaxID=183589 RepID=A0A448ZCR1_9STRA|nr:unnamed protein product [Pseudo-nitzschia multistriata]
MELYWKIHALRRHPAVPCSSVVLVLSHTIHSAERKQTTAKPDRLGDDATGECKRSGNNSFSMSEKRIGKQRRYMRLSTSPVPRSLPLASLLGLVLLLLSVPWFLATDGVSSFPNPTTHTASPGSPRASRVGRCLRASFFDNESDSSRGGGTGNSEDDLNLLKEIRERQLRDAVIEDLFLSQGVRPTNTQSPSSFVSLSLVGQGKLPLAASMPSYDDKEAEKKDDRNEKGRRKTSFASVLVLAPRNDNDFPLDKNNLGSDEDSISIRQPLPALFLPLTAPIESRLQLLSKVYEGKPVSSLTSLILWNLNLINRDGSLFDNIPWNQWTKDPDGKNRDPAGNFVDEKSRYGKRDAFNRFIGKDSNSKTISESQRRYWEKKLSTLLGEKNNDGDGAIDQNVTDEVEDSDSSFSLSFLSKRVLELRIREIRMEIAEVDSQLAVSRNNDISTSNLQELEDTRVELQQTLHEAERNLSDLLSSMSSTSLSDTEATDDRINLFDRIARFALDISMPFRTEQKEAPYRGATGYAPRLSDTEDDSDVEFYRSPYDLLNEILSDQLNAEVIGCVLENTSWLGGNLALEGAVVLRRRTPVVESTLMGETIRAPDRDEDFGNSVKGGEIFVVECDGDEAIGMALSCNLPVKIERTIFERSSIAGVPSQPTAGSDQKDANGNAPKSKKFGTYKNIKENIPYWKPMDAGISLHVEGDRTNRDAERLSPLSIPRTTSSLFDSIFEPESNQGEDKTPSSMFPTDNPIKSIDQLDRLKDGDKAKTLLEMSNFSGRLPRPRTVRNAPADENPLDNLLLPLIDEAVRSEYKIREAERQGDLDLANELKANKSELQKAREKVDAARRDGKEDLARALEDETAFLEALKADVTQDDGAYSRFLDRDDWYERDRQKTAARVKKSSFGNLLDGIE